MDPRELPPAYYRDRLDAKLAAELLGMAKGVIYDGVVSIGEMAGLSAWLDAHPAASAHFPGRELADRLRQIYADGVVSADERESLLSYLTLLTGAADASATAAGDRPTALPLDRPPPTLQFSGGVFVFTGSFALGSREECTNLTLALGGAVKTSVSRAVDYLVVGGLGSEAWITASYGRKIERAAELRAAGQPIAIVEEVHWLESVRRSPGA